ncbi:broad specificity phosphatase PhoE [Streptomyces sp. Ag82_O1-15]|uniref:histidine phosphatase family protein n=1 Tax=Streptomyces sp. Ag82_O1-15 TaxID=1938855 RepID=UPI000BB0D8DC|nr:histidine phosphatase family protein [Streptomyces sp. Ag82_O1-15]PBD00828.1 broad specificity phosphatase PhoE [Streptomyces sp. Ag82_O1-15]
MELVLVRHATSTRSRVGVWGRLYDAPLVDGFEEQLAETRAALESLEKSKVYSSPLLRCLESAAFIFPQKAVRIVEEFRAYHSGFFEEKTEAFIREHNPEYMSLSYRDRFLRPYFDEESMEAQASRVERGILRVLGEGAPISVIVAHYSTINIIAHIGSLNWETDTYADGTYDVAEGAFIRKRVDPVVVLAGIRDRIGRKKSGPPACERRGGNA